MCLILFAYKIHPEYPLVVAANRDEFFGRPASPLGFWEDYPEILAGRDLEKKGTWMGVSKSGRFSALTNYRDFSESTEGKRSRGELVANALLHRGDIRSYMEKISSMDEDYPGYNLLAGNLDDLFYYSNKEGILRKLKPGIYGLSNHLLNTPWPKVEYGKKGLEKIMNENQNLNRELFHLLRHAEPFPDEQLPDTGAGRELEKMLSPLFINGDNYGTRSSAVLLMGSREIIYTERIYKPMKQEEKTFRFEYGA